MEENQEIRATAADFNEEKVLFEWEAPERAYQKRNKDFWITAVAILILVSVILIFIKEFLLIVALISVVFMYYSMSTVPPKNIKNKITNWGIYFGEARYPWNNLNKFWFKKELSNEMIYFGTVLKFPNSVSMVIKAEDREKLKEIIVKRIPLLNESPTFVDKLTKWFGEHLPLEDRKATKKGN